jgi:hypothetical protein
MQYVFDRDRGMMFGMVVMYDSGTVKHGYKNMGYKNNRDIFLSLEVI